MTDIQRALASLSDAGWTWQAVADHLGVRVGTVHSWWSGARRPTYADLVLARLDERRREISHGLCLRPDRLKSWELSILDYNC